MIGRPLVKIYRPRSDSMPDQSPPLVKSNTQAQSQVKMKVLEAQIRYSGPIPPARELQQYEKILPGAAERILNMAEKQQQHRQKIEEKAVETNSKSALRGQVLSFVLLILLGMLGGALLWQGKDFSGMVLALASLAPFVINYRRAQTTARQHDKTGDKKDE